MPKYLWGYIADDRRKARVWHVYTGKAAKHDNGICMARPICGGEPYGLTDANVIETPDRPEHCQAPDSICRTCDLKFAAWQKLQQRGR